MILLIIGRHFFKYKRRCYSDFVYLINVLGSRSRGHDICFVFCRNATCFLVNVHNLLRGRGVEAKDLLTEWRAEHFPIILYGAVSFGLTD